MLERNARDQRGAGWSQNDWGQFEGKRAVEACAVRARATRKRGLEILCAGAGAEVAEKLPQG